MGRALAALAAVTVVAALPACTSETRGPERDVDVADIGGALGEQVTVSAMISAELPGRAFVLAGGAYGDASLLVLTKERAAGLQEGSPIAVTGTVRTFDHGEYAQSYDLAGASKYDRFTGEEFLVANRIDLTADVSE